MIRERWNKFWASRYTAPINTLFSNQQALSDRILQLEGRVLEYGQDSRNIARQYERRLDIHNENIVKCGDAINKLHGEVHGIHEQEETVRDTAGEQAEQAQAGEEPDAAAGVREGGDG